MGKVRELDMTEGSLFKKILVFSLPLMLTSILQLLYNAADIIVVGRYTGSEALAAVGSSAVLINLIVTMVVGFSVGVNVVIAQCFGAKDDEGASKAVSTAMLLSVICGLSLGAIGFFTARLMLVITACPDDVIGLSELYIKIYYTGLPGLVVYNFGASILRGAGDTKRPLLYLGVSGVLNVVLNLFFVIVCKMGVDGVAAATVISQYASAALVVICLMRTQGCLRLRLSEMKIHRKTLFSIIRVGLPAGVQGVLFSISNIIIQSSVNAFGSAVMAGNSAAISVEGFLYVSMESVCQAAVTAAGQNTGAGKYYRIKKILGSCMVIVLAMSVVMGAAYVLFGRELLSIYAPGEEEAIAVGAVRLKVFGYTYFLMGALDIYVGLLRGMGYSTVPMLVSVIGICGIRIVWIYTYFAAYRTLLNLYLSYPISWFITMAVLMVCYKVAGVKQKRLFAPEMKEG